MTNDEIRSRYDGMAPTWRLQGMVDSLLLLNRRRRLFTTAGGSVLDVACGTGENFPFLSGADTVTAFDLSTAMVDEARRRQGQLRMDVDLLVADASRIPFPDGNFDHVVSAFSSCTFPDHVSAFREMARVTRTGGSMLLVEHGRSSVGWIARRADRNIEQVLERSGCRNNRDVLAEIAESGLQPGSVTTSHLGMIHQIVIPIR